MQKATSLWVALVAVASLASCSRSNYAFNNQPAAYASSIQAQPTPPEPAVIEKPTEAKPVAANVAIPSSPATTPLVRATTKPARPLLAQRILLKKLTKQLTKTGASPQNLAHTEKTASKVGQYGIMALIGLAILVIGGVTDVAFLLTFGTVFFLISLVLLIVHLFKGD